MALSSLLKSLVQHIRPTALPARDVNPMGQVVTRGLEMQPRKMKFRKMQKNLRAVKPAIPAERPKPPALKCRQFGIYSLEGRRIKANQLESARMALMRSIGRRGSFIDRMVFPHIPITKKPLGTRMGKGKGAVDHYVAHVRPGKMLFEFDCTTSLKLAHRAVQLKLPIRVAFVQRPEEPE